MKAQNHVLRREGRALRHSSKVHAAPDVSQRTRLEKARSLSESWAEPDLEVELVLAPQLDTWQQLPLGVRHQVCMFLDVRSLGSLTVASKECHVDADHDVVWRRAYQQMFDSPPMGGVIELPSPRTLVADDSSMSDSSSSESEDEETKERKQRLQAAQKEASFRAFKGYKALYYKRWRDPQLGDKVEVSWEGSFNLVSEDRITAYEGRAWWSASIQDKRSGHYGIHYPRWDSMQWDEWVPRYRIRWPPRLQDQTHRHVHVGDVVEVHCPSSSGRSPWMETVVCLIDGDNFGFITPSGMVFTTRDKLRLVRRGTREVAAAGCSPSCVIL